MALGTCITCGADMELAGQGGKAYCPDCAKTMGKKHVLRRKPFLISASISVCLILVFLVIWVIDLSRKPETFQVNFSVEIISGPLEGKTFHGRFVCPLTELDHRKKSQQIPLSYLEFDFADNYYVQKGVPNEGGVQPFDLEGKAQFVHGRFSKIMFKGDLGSQTIGFNRKIHTPSISWDFLRGSLYMDLSFRKTWKDYIDPEQLFHYRLQNTPEYYRSKQASTIDGVGRISYSLTPGTHAYTPSDYTFKSLEDRLVANGTGNDALQFNFNETGPRSIVRFPSLEDTYDDLTMEMWIQFSNRPEHLGKRGALKAHTWIMGFNRVHRIGTSDKATPDYLYYVVGKGKKTVQRVSMKRHNVDPPSQWSNSYHLASVRDNKNKEIRFYVNGKLIGTFPVELKTRPGYLSIAADSDGWYLENSHVFQGAIEEVRISDSARYIGDFRLPPRTLPKDENTAALYHFDEGEGDVLKDASGNKHHGKIENATWTKN